ncbi:MAG: hypothetical protein R2867_45330 [Caldilineaceae bacterium]
MIMAWPGVIAPGQRYDRVVSAFRCQCHDAFDALNAPALPHSPGRSLLGLVTAAPVGAGRGTTAWEDLVFAEYCEDQYSYPVAPISAWCAVAIGN